MAAVVKTDKEAIEMSYFNHIQLGVLSTRTENILGDHFYNPKGEVNLRQHLRINR